MGRHERNIRVDKQAAGSHLGNAFWLEFSTFNHQTTEASSGKLVQFFLYGRARQMFSHDLELEKYGTEGEWVIIQKVSK